MIYSSGNNSHGQLGLGHSNEVSIPTEMNLQQQHFKGGTIVSVSCSWNISYGHSFGITQTGKLFTWGYNENGQLGLNHKTSVNAPHPCNSDIFGVNIQENDKMYKNEYFEDVKTDFK